MADVTYQGGLKALVEGSLQSAADLRLALVTANFSGYAGSGSPQASYEDVINVADFTTLGEFAGVGYQRIDCANVVVAYDATLNRYTIDFDDAEFNTTGGTVAAGPYAATGILVILFVDGTEANDLAIGFTDSGGFPINGAGTPIQLTVATGGLLAIEGA